MAQKKLRTMHELLERLINDPESPTERIESVHKMAEEERKRDSELAFNDALREVQKEVAKVSADATNTQTRSKYATYEQLDRALRPKYTGHGFSISFDTDEAPEEFIRVVAILSHEAGHSRRYHVDIPVVTEGIQGKVNMTKTHAVASAQSYGMRYLLKMIFNVAIGEDDDDGNAAGLQPITAQQAKELDKLLTDYTGDDEVTRDAFFSWLSSELKASSIEALNQNAYERVRDTLKRRIQKKQKEAS